MIDREQWAEIYDWARYNGISPVDFINQAIVGQNISPKSEEIIYLACKDFSLRRTNYPTEG